MKGRKPNYQERKIMDKLKLDTYTWMIQKNTPEFIQFVRKVDENTEEIIVIDKNILAVTETYKKNRKE